MKRGEPKTWRWTVGLSLSQGAWSRSRFRERQDPPWPQDSKEAADVQLRAFLGESCTSGGDTPSQNRCGEKEGGLSAEHSGVLGHPKGTGEESSQRPNGARGRGGLSSGWQKPACSD